MKGLPLIADRELDVGRDGLDRCAHQVAKGLALKQASCITNQGPSCCKGENKKNMGADHGLESNLDPTHSHVLRKLFQW